MKRKPVLVVSGFLGAGKTTLINQLLVQKPARERLGIIVNDFGRINVDGTLLTQGADAVLELSGGCICCSLQVGLVQAVDTLAEREDLDRLVIEASGISILSALLTALTGSALAQKIQIVQVVTVIDGRRYLKAMHTLPVIADQMAHAQLLLLNHRDEIPTDLIDATLEHVRREWPETPIIVTERGHLPWDRLWSELPPRIEPMEAHHHHDHWIGYEVMLPARVDPSQVLQSLDRLPEAAERVKGLSSNAGELLIFQKVGSEPATLERRRGPGAERSTNTLVVLAREPIDEALRRLFAGWATVSRSEE